MATGAAQPRGAGVGRAGPSPVGAPPRSSWSRWPSSPGWLLWSLLPSDISRAISAYSHHTAAFASQVVPAPVKPPATPAEPDKPARSSRYIPWAELPRARNSPFRTLLPAVRSASRTRSGRLLTCDSLECAFSPYDERSIPEVTWQSGEVRSKPRSCAICVQA
jgi:hypothetical protein